MRYSEFELGAIQGLTLFSILKKIFQEKHPEVGWGLKTASEVGWGQFLRFSLFASRGSDHP